MLFLVSASLVWVVALLVTAWDFVGVQGMEFRFGVVNIVGWGFFLLGVCLRLASGLTLKRNFTHGLKIREHHRLIKHGVYRRVRHPAYLGSILLDEGIPLIFSSFYGALLMLGLIPLLIYRIRVEELMLVKRFGDEYRKYAETTQRLVPFLY